MDYTLFGTEAVLDFRNSGAIFLLSKLRFFLIRICNSSYATESFIFSRFSSEKKFLKGSEVEIGKTPVWAHRHKPMKMQCNGKGRVFLIDFFLKIPGGELKTQSLRPSFFYHHNSQI